MRYQGGKVRTARKIAESIAPSGVYIEPFLGGGSVAAAVAARGGFSELFLGDAQPDLYALWRAGLDGWKPPVSLTRDEYNTLRASSEHSALRGWAAFACSHSGKYFGSYGATASGRDYIAEACRLFEKKVDTLRASSVPVHLYLTEYDAWRPRAGDVVYADPPYASTEGYAGLPPFDSERFWQVMNQWAADGVSVYVSEYSAPPGWVPLWTVDRAATLDPSSSKRTAESLYVRESA